MLPSITQMKEITKYPMWNFDNGQGIEQIEGENVNPGISYKQNHNTMNIKGKMKTW
jgi:hypothetical protein